MQQIPGFSAIGYVHYRIAGGYKQILVIAAIYAALLVGLAVFMMAQVSSTGRVSPASFYRNFGNSSIFLQAIVLLIFGTYRVAAAIRLDHISNMIESHRLMPVSAPNAILGYVIGATSPAWALAIVNLLLATFMNILGGGEFAGMLIAHAIIIAFAFYFWTATALAAITARALVGFISSAPLLLLLTQGTLFMLAPALHLIASPLLGRTVFFTDSLAGLLTPALAVSIGAQFASGSLFFFAAARRYRRPDQPAILPWVGLALLVIWTTLTLVALGRIDGLYTGMGRLFFFIREPGRFAQFITSTLIAMLLMLIPIANAAWYFIHNRRAHPETPGLFRELAALGVVAGSVLITLVISCSLFMPVERVVPTSPFVPGIAPMTLPASGPAPAIPLLPSTKVIVEQPKFGMFSAEHLTPAMFLGLSLLGFAVSMHYLLRIVYRGGSQRSALIGFIWLVLIAGLPLIIDFVRAMYSRGSDDNPISAGGAISPIGLAALVFMDSGEFKLDAAIFATIVQAILGGGMAWLYYLTGKPAKPTKLPPAAVPVPTLPENPAPETGMGRS